MTSQDYWDRVESILKEEKELDLEAELAAFHQRLLDTLWNYQWRTRKLRTTPTYLPWRHWDGRY